MYAEYEADLVDLTNPKARKQHTCDECKGGIAIGEIYTRCRELVDGVWGGWVMCKDCDRLHGELREVLELFPGEGIALGALQAAMKEARVNYGWSGL